MADFTFYAPTQIVFGRGGENQIGALVKAQNGKKVLLHYGGGSARRSGLLDRIRAVLSFPDTAGQAVPRPAASLPFYTCQYYSSIAEADAHHLGFFHDRRVRRYHLQLAGHVF